MYQLTKEELARLGAEITTREIHQQPKLWQETLENYEKAYERVTLFLASVKKKYNESCASYLYRCRHFSVCG